jgi:hypothetical protein
MAGIGGVAARLAAQDSVAVKTTGSRIARIEAFPLRYAMRGRFKFFEGPDGSPTGRAAVFIKVTDDETLETVTTTIHQYLAPELIGRDPTDIAGAHAVMDHAIAPAFSTGQPIAKAGIDLALHDLAGRIAGKRADRSRRVAGGFPGALFELPPGAAGSPQRTAIPGRELSDDAVSSGGRHPRRTHRPRPRRDRGRGRGAARFRLLLTTGRWAGSLAA